MKPSEISLYVSQLAKEYGVTYDQVVCKRRFRWLVAIRATICKRLRDDLGMRPGAIGMAVNRDRSTVIELLKKKQNRGSRR